MRRYNCSVYIDESGNDGLTDKSTKNFVLGGFIVYNKDLDFLNNKILEFENKIKKEIHCSNRSINHFMKVYLAKQLSELPIKIFSVISQKITLINNYTPKDNQEYYNKNVQYLLERIGDFIEKTEQQGNKIILTNIIFEKRKNHNYEKLKHFIKIVKNNPLRAQSKSLTYIDTNIISARDKGDNLLKIADIISHSVYRAINPDDDYNITEHRYIEEFKNKFYANKNKILGYGIKILLIRECDFIKEDIDYIKNLKITN